MLEMFLLFLVSLFKHSNKDKATFINTELLLLFLILNFHKQLFKGVLWKRISENFAKPVQESILDIVTDLFKKSFLFSCELYKIFQGSLFAEHFVSVVGHKNCLTIISVDFLEGPFDGKVKGGNYVPCLKLVRIMLEICYIGTHPYTVLENMPFSTKTLLILLISASFVKNWVFFCINSTFSQSNSVGAVLDIFSSVFSFCKIKGCVNENITFTGYAFGIQLPDCSKLAINRKNDNDVPFSRYDVIVNFFLTLFCFSC